MERLVDLGGEVAASEGPPSTEQQTAMGRLQDDLKRFGQIDLALLFVTITAMSTARCW